MHQFIGNRHSRHIPCRCSRGQVPQELGKPADSRTDSSLCMACPVLILPEDDLLPKSLLKGLCSQLGSLLNIPNAPMALIARTTHRMTCALQTVSCLGPYFALGFLSHGYFLSSWKIPWLLLLPSLPCIHEGLVLPCLPHTPGTCQKAASSNA